MSYFRAMTKTTPKHEGLEQLQALREKLKAPPAHKGMQDWQDANLRFTDFKKYQGTFARTSPPVAPPKDMLEMYLGSDLRQLQQDMLERPDHYTDRQHEILQNLIHGVTVSPPPTTQERDELLYSLVRPTEVARKTKDLIEKITEERNKEEVERRSEEDETIMEDGRTYTEWMRERASFQNQKYQKPISFDDKPEDPEPPPTKK